MPTSTPLPPPPPIERRRDALFLDLDGTLAPIVPHPDDARVAPEMIVAVGRLREALGGRVAVVSGRDLATIDRLLHPLELGSAGVHGLERRLPSGVVEVAAAVPGMDAARDMLVAAIEREPRLLLEDKGRGIAVHYRAAPDLEAAAREAASAAAAANGLVVQTGKMVFEVRQPGADKGSVVRSFMDEAPFAGGRPVFVGDDDTDEHGFAAARDLGGYGVLVGAPRATAAAFGLGSVEAVLGWIGAAA
jgi:trehalose 6-phosphate phosphatase